MKYPKFWGSNFANNLPPYFKNTLVSKNDIDVLLKTYADEVRILSQPRRITISSFTLHNGTLITPLLLFYLKFGLVCAKKHRSFDYTPRIWLNSCVQSAVDARKQKDENPNSSVVAETMKLLAKSYSGNQKIDRSQQTLTKHLSHEKTHAAINRKHFRKPIHKTNALYGVEVAKAVIDDQEPIILGFFNPQYAKHRISELH